jgi:hypothetical protein
LALTREKKKTILHHFYNLLLTAWKEIVEDSQPFGLTELKLWSPLATGLRQHGKNKIKKRLQLVAIGF